MSSSAEAIASPAPEGPGGTVEAAAGGLRDVPGATWACFAVCVVGYLALIAMVLTSKNDLWWDEVWYLRSVPELHRLGLSVEWIRGLPGPSGPLFALVHALLEPLTGLRSPGIRLATIGITALTVVALAAALKARRVPHAFPKAAGLLAVPMLYGAIGTAMTEMPAALFFCASLAALFAAAYRAERGDRSAYPLAILAGVACGVAITGRQHYLMAPLASVALWRRRTWKVALIYGALGVGVPAPVFFIWDGLVPPFMQAEESGLSLAHGLSAISYAGVIYCLYDVGWLLRRPVAVALVVAACIALNVATGTLDHVPFLRVAMRNLSPTALHYYGLVASGVMLGFGLAFLLHLAGMAFERRGDAVDLFLCVASAILLAAPAKIVHMFAGRYIATSIPLLLILGTERSPDTYGKAARLALGCLGGLISLRVYLAPV
jgi:hypothetical protein